MIKPHTCEFNPEDCDVVAEDADGEHLLGLAPDLTLPELIEFTNNCEALIDDQADEIDALEEQCRYLESIIAEDRTNHLADSEAKDKRIQELEAMSPKAVIDLLRAVEDQKGTIASLIDHSRGQQDEIEALKAENARLKSAAIGFATDRTKVEEMLRLHDKKAALEAQIKENDDRMGAKPFLGGPVGGAVGGMANFAEVQQAAQARRSAKACK